MEDRFISVGTLIDYLVDDIIFYMNESVDAEYLDECKVHMNKANEIILFANKIRRECTELVSTAESHNAYNDNHEDNKDLPLAKWETEYFTDKAKNGSFPKLYEFAKKCVEKESEY